MTTSALSVEQRLEALENGAKFEATAAAIKQVEAAYLIQLREIKQALAQGDGGVASSKQVQDLKDENETLKKKISKLEYRIEHMVASIESLYEENKQLKAKS